jgi:DNA repair photolyase
LLWAGGGLMTALTVTTMDNAVASLIEPGSPRPAERMAAMAELKRERITSGVHLMPIIPYLTSGEESLEAVFNAAKNVGADYVLTASLNLKGPTRKGFYDSIMRSFPSEYSRIRSLYQDSKAYGEYKQQLHEAVNRLRTKYKMPAYISPPQNPAPTQLSFL